MTYKTAIHTLRPLALDDLASVQSIILIDKVEHRGDLRKIDRIIKSGCLAVFMEITPALKQSSLYKRWIASNMVRQFTWHIATFVEMLRCQEDAYDTIENVYSSLNEAGKLPLAPLMKLFNHEDVALALKKGVIDRLVKFFETVRYAECIKQKGCTVSLFATPALMETRRWILQSKGINHLPGSIMDDELLHQQRRDCLDRFRRFVAKIYSLVHLFCILPWVLTRVRKIRRRALPVSIQLAVRVFNNDYGIHRGVDTTRVDWMIDNKRLRRDNSLFVAEDQLSMEYKAEFHKQGYLLCDLFYKKAFSSVSLSFILRDLFLKSFIIYCSLFANWFRFSDSFIRLLSVGLIDYLRFKVFLEQWNPKHYIAYQSKDYKHIFRNILLSKAECESWWYGNSNSWQRTYNYKNEISSRHIYWAYMKYDHEIHWSNHLMEMFKDMRSHSGSFSVVGPIWSSFIGPSEHLCTILKEKWGNTLDGPLVVGFNATYGIGGINRDEDHLGFLRGFKRLLGHPDYPELKVVFKPKNQFNDLLESKNPDIAEESRYILNHPRFLVLDAHISSSSAIYQADLVLSMACTSPGIEALIYGRRVVYYDACSRFPHSYLDSFPDLIAHNEGKMIELVSKWLKYSPKDVQSYVDKYILPNYGGDIGRNSVEFIRECLAK